MLLRMLQLGTPDFVIKKVIRELSCITADAFQSEPLDLHGLSGKACLGEYARYTNELALMAINNGGDIEAVKTRLYQNAFFLGQKVRQRLHVASQEDVIAASRLVYKILGIAMVADGQGAITINSCFFSRFYCAEVCRIMSSLDEGMAAGLSGSGKLEFYQRMTQGNDCCKAHFTMRGEQR